MRRAARVDATAKALTTLARELGFYVVVLNGVVDAMLYHPRTGLLAVDWKTPKVGQMTPAQQRLVMDGFPIEFISTPEQLKALLGIEEAE